MAYNEYNAYQRDFRTLAHCGQYCGDERCGGWVLSQLDVWERCLCWSGQTHPEVANMEAELEAEADRETYEANELPARLEAPRPWHPVPVVSDDDIPF